MLSATLKLEIENLIREGKTGQALELIQNEDISNSTKQALIVIQAEYKQLKTAELKRTIQPQDLQISKNQINDKILSLINSNPTTIEKSKTNIWKFLIPIFIIGLGGLFFWKNQNSKTACPNFSHDVNNNILVIPFENLGSEKDSKKPHVKLANQINLLAKKKKLSSNAEVGQVRKNMSMTKAKKLANGCNADLVIWGEYESNIDSFRFIVNYYYPLNPEASNFGKLNKIKNLIALDEGKMEKNLKDAILSLCGIIAFREDKLEVAKTWFDKVEKKEKIDQQFLDRIN